MWRMAKHRKVRWPGEPHPSRAKQKARVPETPKVHKVHTVHSVKQKSENKRKRMPEMANTAVRSIAFKAAVESGRDTEVQPETASELGEVCES